MFNTTFNNISVISWQSVILGFKKKLNWECEKGLLSQEIKIYMLDVKEKND
jgi:hypothetical protein